ncbi:MAG: aldo/keto reductase [Planctomycetota bacterium]
MNVVQNVQLRDGAHLPSVGMGLWKVANSTAADLVVEAARLGYRHFDSAADYGNEREVGDGLRRVIVDGVCTRDALWVTGKLWNTDHHPNHVREAAQRSLADLGLERFDLYLMHFPIALAHVPHAVRYPAGWLHDPDAASPAMKPARVPIAETWGAMERLVEEGLVARIGVCNFGVSLVRDLIASASTPPAVLQVELHPRLTQAKLLRFCREEGIAVEGFSPLGAQSYFELGMAGEEESLLSDATVRSVADRVGRTPAQVLLRWGVQRGTAVLPKSSSPGRLRENLSLFDFTLSEEAVSALDALDAARRYNDPGVFCESAFNTFLPIYE